MKSTVRTGAVMLAAVVLAVSSVGCWESQTTASQSRSANEVKREDPGNERSSSETSTGGSGSSSGNGRGGEHHAQKR